MLESLYVKNLALLDKTEVRFMPGLNILSGETGAGKSILIDAVLMALGGKAPKEMIRSREKEAYIELVFSVRGDSVKQRLAAMDVELEDDLLIISRRITGTRSLCKVNGESVTAARVREVASLVIDIHGQHEHQSLLYGSKQLELVDRCDREHIYPLRQQVTELYERYQACREELDQSSMDESMRMRTVDILNYEIDEIERAQISVGEEKRLEQEWKRLHSQGLIEESLTKLSELLSADNRGAGDLLGLAESCARDLTEYDESYQELFNQLMDAESIVNDCSHIVSRSLDDQDAEEGRLEEVEERLDEIRHLMQKYSCNEEGLLQLLEQKKQELEKYLNLEEIKKRLEKKAGALRRDLKKSAGQLSVLRDESRKILEKQLTEAMIDLNFLDVRFEIRMHETKEIGRLGKDEAAFYIATNPGEELKPLSMVASGGELSRIMLAIKSVLAKKEETETLIFDEIDAGISGRTAQKVANRLNLTARSAQVICISHLPQIVAMADTHFLIHKEAKDQITTTYITHLEKEESVRELARLLGGSEITDRVLENAREMKDMAEQAKQHGTS